MNKGKYVSKYIFKNAFHTYFEISIQSLGINFEISILNYVSEWIFQREFHIWYLRQWSATLK